MTEHLGNDFGVDVTGEGYGIRKHSVGKRVLVAPSSSARRLMASILQNLSFVSALRCPHGHCALGKRQPRRQGSHAPFLFTVVAVRRGTSSADGVKNSSGSRRPSKNRRPAQPRTRGLSTSETRASYRRRDAAPAPSGASEVPRAKTQFLIH
jgi:hypothetical protein